jgi:hypothetical protein
MLRERREGGTEYRPGWQRYFSAFHFDVSKRVGFGILKILEF